MRLTTQLDFREVGINAVTFGPGEDGWAPDNESISIIQKLLLPQKMYALTIIEILGIEEGFIKIMNNNQIKNKRNIKRFIPPFYA